MATIKKGQLWTRGGSSVWIKAPKWLADAAREADWSKVSGTTDQSAYRTRLIINSKNAAKLAEFGRKHGPSAVRGTVNVARAIILRK